MVAILEHAGYLQKTLQRLLAVAEPLDVRDLLVRFQSEPKAFRHAFCPVQQRRFDGHLVKTVIDLDGRKLLGVKAEHLAVGKPLWIEVPLPFLVGVSRSAHAQLAGASDDAPPVPRFNHNHRAWQRVTRPGLPRRLAIAEALVVREGPVVMPIRAFSSFET